MGRWRIAAGALAAVLLAGAASGRPDDGTDAIAGGILRGVEKARNVAGLGSLRQDPAIEEAARRRAEEVAARPEGRRFASQQPIAEYVREAGLRRFRRASQYVATQGGYDNEVESALANWLGYAEAWNKVLDPAWTAAGAATKRTSDGLLVIVAVFVEDDPPLPPPQILADQTWMAVNAERKKRGLAPLVWSDSLARIATAHSDDMARRGYMAHESPEGAGPDERARRAGIEYRSLAENVASNLHVDDPVEAAVTGWLESRSHRRNLLDPEFTHTGIGVAVDEEGRVVFTQLFLLPVDSGRAERKEPP